MSTHDREATRADDRACDDQRVAGSPDPAWFGAGIFDALPSPMALVAPDGVIAVVNAAWCRLTGDRPEADVGQPLWRRFSPSERSHLAALVERYATAGEGAQRPIVAGTQLRRTDGRRVDVALRLGATTEPGARRMLLVQLEPLAEDRARTARRVGTGDRQMALATISRAVASGGDLTRIAPTVIGAVGRASGCPLVGVWRREQRTAPLGLVDGAGFPPAEHGRLTLPSDVDGFASHVLRARNVIVVGGPTGTTAPLPAPLRERGAVTGAAVGIHGAAGADGLLTVSAPHNHPLPPDVVRFLAVTGDLLSMAAQREDVDHAISAERRRTTEVVGELERTRRRLDVVRDAADLIEWRWVAPVSVEHSRGQSAPVRMSVAACLDGGPQALADASVDTDRELVAAAVERCLDDGTELDETVRIDTGDGLVRVRLRGTVERARDGSVREISGVARAEPAHDDTPTPLDDGQADRLARAAHDLNNLLAAILGTAEQLVEDGGDRRRLTAIVRAGRRARELVNGLQPDDETEHPLAGTYELADVVEHLRPLLPGLVGTDVALTYALHRGARASEPARREIERVLLNLISNSGEAIDGGGTIHIAVDTCIQRRDGRARPSAPPEGSWARLTVRDDGRGMPEAERARAFERGFTTKRATAHTGLGLASVRETVGRAGGVVGITSAVGRGTTVDVYLPLAPRGAARLQPLRPRALGTGSSTPRPAADDRRRVALLVDDEPAVRELLTELLERLGYAVSAADGGDRALTVASQLDEIHLLVSDLHMPGMDGVTLGRRVRARHRDAAIVLLTGAPPSTPIADRRLRVVRKPFDWETLRDAVHSLAPPRPADPVTSPPMYPAASG